MGTPIAPDPNYDGADCAVCSGAGMCFDNGTPDRIRIFVSDIEGCHPHNNPPDGPYVCMQGGLGQECVFKYDNFPDMVITITFHNTAGSHLAYYRIGLQSYYYYMRFFLECALLSTNRIDTCAPAAVPPEIGVGGSIVVEPFYTTDLQFYAYGSGFFSDYDMKYDVGNCADGNKWYRFASVPDRINCLVKGKVSAA